MTHRIRKSTLQHSLVLGSVVLWGVMEFVALSRASRTGRDQAAANP